MAITLRVIKPAEFKVNDFFKQLDVGLEKTGEVINEKFAKTTATWRRHVVFQTKFGSFNGFPGVLVFTEDQIYVWVNYGTPEHPVTPVSADWLRFQIGYKAKTERHVIGSSAGGPFGPQVRTQFVMNPGITSREFDVVIANEITVEYPAIMRDALDKAVIASGHAFRR